MKKIAIAVLLVFSFSIFAGCAGMQYQQPGTAGNSNAGYCAAGGAATGAIVGSQIGPRKNRLENTLIGMVAGALSFAIA
ncbi:MAG: glycine zipper 2TM domain-containing protein [Parcubacteria group bacterium]